MSAARPMPDLQAFRLARLRDRLDAELDAIRRHMDAAQTAPDDLSMCNAVHRLWPRINAAAYDAVLKIAGIYKAAEGAP